MSRPLLSVDFNEMLEPDLVLLSVDDRTSDAQGQIILLREGLEIDIYSDDVEDRSNPLVARGVVERNNTAATWAAHVKWCCRIDAAGIHYQSDLPAP